MPRSFDLKFKLEVLNYAEQNSGEAAARKFGVTPSTIRGWKRNKEEIVFTALYASDGAKKKRVQGAGRKLISAELESDLMEWILEKQRNHERVSRKMIRKIASDIFASYEDSRKETFKASPGWLSKFLKRNNLSLRHKLARTQNRHEPDEINKKIARFIHRTDEIRTKHAMQPHEIVALDETGVWFDMPGAWTCEKPDELTYNASEKMFFTVILAARGDGSKLRPFIVFKRLNLDDKAPFDVPGVVMSSSINGWMNEELIPDLLRHVFSRFSPRKRLLVWDAYRHHVSESTKTQLERFNASMAVVPAGLTKCVQAADVCWKKPFKSLMDERFSEWISGAADKELAEDGRLKPPSCRLVGAWVEHAWEMLATDFVRSSFKVCGLTTSVDGSEDHLIDCLRVGGTFGGAWALLQNYRQNECGVVDVGVVEDSDENEQNEQSDEVLIDSSDEENEDG